MKDNQGVMIAGTAVAVGITLFYYLWRRWNDQSKWKEVATVDKLYIHPVKSCRGMSVDSFTCFEQLVMLNGSEIGDRSFMMVHEYGKFATIRQYPKMVLVRPSVVGRDRLRLEAPGMEPLEIVIPAHNSQKLLNYKVWDVRCPGVDCGDEAAAWLHKFLGVNTARLVFHDKKLKGKERTKLLEFGHLGVYAKGPVKSVFHDYSPFNIVSQASIDFLNTKLDSDHKVTERFFRPNVVLKGCEAFAEDKWKRIRIGSAEFLFAKHCTRCHVTTVNPETGVKDHDLNTLTALSEFRLCPPEERLLYGSSPKFSVDFITIQEGKIKVGDKVFLYVGDEGQ